ncbi:MAG: DUF1893 domain-containing protein [Oscillospiraceae bacterium]
MQSKLDKAIKKLHDENLCCVVIKGDECFTSTDFGIKPLMIFLRQDQHFFQNAVIADKIIGKAAALLMILGGAEQVYGEVMSEAAIGVLEVNSIDYKYGETVPYIKNRTDTGMCPMEETVKNISSPKEAFDALEKTIAILMSKK